MASMWERHDNAHDEKRWAAQCNETHSLTTKRPTFAARNQTASLDKQRAQRGLNLANFVPRPLRWTPAGKSPKIFNPPCP
eukprot:6590373-Alexandrium_andersonii.AAC.1